MYALDLCCRAGGASEGLRQAGFIVHGVDIEPQRSYPFPFTCYNALEYPLYGYDLIWASPPCHAYSEATRFLRKQGKVYPDLVAPIRARLIRSGIPYIIENVPGAPLVDPIMLCGSMFGINVIRHRLFECSFPVPPPPRKHQHTGDEIPVYGNGTPSWHRKKWAERDAAQCAHTGLEIPVYGHNVPRPKDDRRRGGNGKGCTVQEQRDAMEIQWMKRSDLTQAIPPAYSRYLGRVALAHLARTRPCPSSAASLL